MDVDGKVLWAGEDDFGFGPCVIVNDVIYAMDDHGRLVLIKATERGYNKLSEYQVLDGHDSWGPIAIVDNKMILRDLKQMICFEISSE